MRFCSCVSQVILSVFVAGTLHAAQSLDTIIIDTGYDKQTKIAVVPFSQGPEYSNFQAMSDIVDFDLARSGQFAPTEVGNMLSYPVTSKDVFFRDWRILGVEYCRCKDRARRLVDRAWLRGITHSIS